MSTERETRYVTVVADDVPEHLDVLRTILEASRRFEIVATASTGTGAVAAVARCRPDLVLLDVTMPELDGIEAVPMIRSASPASRVVLVSARSSDAIGPGPTGISDHLAKDLPPAVLIARLLEVMESEPLQATTEEGPAGGGRAGRSVPEALQMSAEEMVSAVAHEVRNHLAVIQGFGVEVHTRWNELPDDMKRDAVRRMTDRARYLNTVVNNLMFMRRLSSDHVWTDTSPVAVAEMVRTMVIETEDLARGHDLRLEVAPGLPEASADPYRLRQVLTNLIVNAAKFSPSEAPISVSIGVDHRGVLIRVRDEGPGVPETHAERVFEKFTRLEESGSGIGLGLFISRELMRSMNGDLLLEDPGTRGAAFTCVLESVDPRT